VEDGGGSQGWGCFGVGGGGCFFVLLGFFLGVPMPKNPAKKPAKAKLTHDEIASLDLDPSAWPKFEKLIKDAAKMGPKPHKVTKA
jgi:hypothetical protein